MSTTQQATVQTPGTLNDYPLAGSCEGRFVLTSLSSEFLQSLLPSQLILAPQNYSPEGSHPVMLMYNYTHLQSTEALSKIADMLGLELRLNYNEFILMLPFVQFKNNEEEKDNVYCYLPVLYLDSLLAVLGGRIFWEFNKEMARFKVSDTDVLISSEIFNEPYFNSSFLTSGSPVPARSLPNFEALVPILNLPVVEFGPEGYVTSIYKMDYENASIIPSSASVLNHSSKYFPDDASIFSQSIKENVLGAFNMNYNWELSWTKKIGA